MTILLPRPGPARAKANWILMLNFLCNMAANLKLKTVLVSSNDNSKYLDFWPVVREAWNRIVGIRCVLVYVGKSLPEHLCSDPDVHFFEAIDEWPTATQAQCIRLLYPSLIKFDDKPDGKLDDTSSYAVAISDIDMVPMQLDYYIKGFGQFSSDQFVSLRGVDEHYKQVYICYVGATPKTWGEIFNIQTVDDVRNRLKDWAAIYPADGIHGMDGGKGWCTDQVVLYNRVKALLASNPERVGLVPWAPTVGRLCRSQMLSWNTHGFYTNYVGIPNTFIDFHMPNYQENKAIIHEIVDRVALKKVDLAI